MPDVRINCYSFFPVHRQVCISCLRSRTTCVTSLWLIIPVGVGSLNKLRTIIRALLQYEVIIAALRGAFLVALSPSGVEVGRTVWRLLPERIAGGYYREFLEKSGISCFLRFVPH